MSESRAIRRVAVHGFAADPASAQDAWPGDRGGVSSLDLVALGSALEAAAKLGQLLDHAVDLHLEEDRSEVLCYAVPRRRPDPRSLADLGREEGSDTMLGGWLEGGARPSLTVFAVDCERRREIGRVRIDDPDPSRWGGLAADACAAMLGRPAEDASAPSSALDLERALDLMDARTSLHAFDHSPSRARLLRAREMALRVLEHDPGRRPAQLLLVGSLLRGQAAEGELLDRVAALAGRLPEVPRVETYGVLGRSATTEQMLEWLADEVEDPVAEQMRRRLRVASLARAERLDEAREEGRAAVTAFPRAVELLRLCANLEEDGSSAEFVPAAQELWRRLLEIEPDDSEALAGRIAGLVEEEPDAAAEHAVRALGQPRVPNRSLEAAVRLLDPPREANEAWREAVRGLRVEEGADPARHAFMAALLERCGEAGRASLHATVALDHGLFHPFAARIWSLRRRPGDFEWAARMDRLALKAFSSRESQVKGESEAKGALAAELAAELEGADPPHREFLLAIAVSRDEDLEQAARHFEAAARDLPRFPEAGARWGMCLLELGKDQEACAPLERAARALPRHASVRYAACLALLGCQRAEEALVHLQATLQLDPSHAGARALRDKLSDRAREARGGGGPA